MLKSIDPLLNADVLYALRSMGHGDELIICDTNFPADSVAHETVLGKLLRIDASAARVAGTGPMPMVGGSTPATPVETILALGVSPRSFTA